MSRPVSTWPDAQVLRRGDLVQVLPRHTVQALKPIHAVYYRSGQMSPRIACFLDFMDEQLAQAAWNVR